MLCCIHRVWQLQMIFGLLGRSQIDPSGGPVTESRERVRSKINLSGLFLFQTLSNLDGRQKSFWNPHKKLRLNHHKIMAEKEDRFWSGAPAPERRTCSYSATHDPPHCSRAFSALFANRPNRFHFLLRLPLFPLPRLRLHRHVPPPHFLLPQRQRLHRWLRGCRVLT